MKLLLDRGVWIVITLIIVYICTDFIWFKENENKEAELISLQHEKLIQKYNELNELYLRADYRSDGNTQHIDSVHSKINNLLVGDKILDLTNEDHNEANDKLFNLKDYNNKDLSYYHQLDEINLQFRRATDELSAITEKMLTLHDMNKKDLEKLSEEYRIALISFKKYEKELKNLVVDLKNNSLIMIDSRWKDIDIDELYREYQLD